jgi:1,4-dihydroxy-6-naphthoate synthase
MKLTLGFSPCPNDTFIFDALVNNKIDTGGLELEVALADVETINQWALDGRLDITKLSLPAFFRNTDKYVLLNSGAALGKGVGPLLISKSAEYSPQSEIKNLRIALPGENTTANLLFTFAYPDAGNKLFIRFDKIETAVLSGEAELGVIIHENRFTYRQKGLHKITDLGEYWESIMHVPIPLGGIAFKRSVDQLISLKVDMLIRKSIEFAFSNYPFIPDYVKQHSQEMNEEVMRQHIELYVNNYSLNLGADGKKAIETLYSTFLSRFPQQISSTPGILFLS